MKFAVLLGAIALLPIAFVVGYSAHKQPAPAFGVYAAQELHVRHVPGQDVDNWVAVAVTGPNKGGAVDAMQAMFMAKTHKLLEAQAQGKIIYVEMKCQNYTSNGEKLVYKAQDIVQRCSTVRKSRKEVEKYVLDLMRAEPAS
jgi:hypothetical protein